MASPWRALSAEEIAQLAQQGCTCNDWSKVQVADGFRADRVRMTHFCGDIRLGVFEKEISFYGGVTKRDLTSLGGILFMGLLGLIVVMVLQIFFFADSSTASLLIGIGGVVIFTGLTAWDVQRLKNGNMPNINKESATVLGALALYLDFVNLFLFMLRIFGSSR